MLMHNYNGVIKQEKCNSIIICLVALTDVPADNMHPLMFYSNCIQTYSIFFVIRKKILYSLPQSK